MTAFDTALMEALQSVGIPPDRARAVVDTFDRAIGERYSLHGQVPAATGQARHVSRAGRSSRPGAN